jgi:hypothetical protein
VNKSSVSLFIVLFGSGTFSISRTASCPSILHAHFVCGHYFVLTHCVTSPFLNNKFCC